MDAGRQPMQSLFSYFFSFSGAKIGKNRNNLILYSPDLHLTVKPPKSFPENVCSYRILSSRGQAIFFFLAGILNEVCGAELRQRPPYSERGMSNYSIP
jgi:hypothetical protein